MTKTANLSKCLVEKHGISQADADNFIAEFFAIIRERIETDKQVKIKGLGTFKLAEMSARESVDINSGERIIIEGKNKISFTPENAVRDRINAPFAQFESVDIDDDIDFSHIDEKYSEEETEPVDDSIDEPTEVEHTITTTESLSLPVVNEVVVPVIEETKEIEIVEENNAVEQNVDVEDTVEETVKQPNNQTATIRSPYCEDLIREGITHSRKIMKMLYALFALGIISLLVIAGYCCYQIGINTGMKKSSAIHADSVKTKKEVVKTTSVAIEQKKDSVKNKNAEVAKVVKEIQPELPAKTVQIATQNATDLKEQTTVIPDQSKYYKNPRVRTGAYVIMGLDTTVTLQKGQTFSGICKAYLGEGMECYVEAFNDGMKEAKAGDKIKIPKLKLKKSIKK